MGAADQAVVLQGAEVTADGLLGHAQLGGERGHVDRAGGSGHPHDLALALLGRSVGHGRTLLSALPLWCLVVLGCPFGPLQDFVQRRRRADQVCCGFVGARLCPSGRACVRLGPGCGVRAGRAGARSWSRGRPFLARSPGRGAFRALGGGGTCASGPRRAAGVGRRVVVRRGARVQAGRAAEVPPAPTRAAPSGTTARSRMGWGDLREWPARGGGRRVLADGLSCGAGCGSKRGALRRCRLRPPVPPQAARLPAGQRPFRGAGNCANGP